MKGLDGIQWPIYVGTGCVFKRHAFYGYDAPKREKGLTRTCKCVPKWFCFGFCCSDKRKKKKANKLKNDINEIMISRMTNYQHVCALDGINKNEGKFKKNLPLYNNVFLSL